MKPRFETELARRAASAPTAATNLVGLTRSSVAGSFNSASGAGASPGFAKLAGCDLNRKWAAAGGASAPMREGTASAVKTAKASEPRTSATKGVHRQLSRCVVPIARILDAD